VHSDCFFFCVCTNILTYLLTYLILPLALTLPPSLLPLALLLTNYYYDHYNYTILHQVCVQVESRQWIAASRTCPTDQGLPQSLVVSTVSLPTSSSTSAVPGTSHPTHMAWSHTWFQNKFITVLMQRCLSLQDSHD